MSLEQQLANNTEALVKLTEAVCALTLKMSGTKTEEFDEQYVRVAHASGRTSKEVKEAEEQAAREEEAAAKKSAEGKSSKAATAQPAGKTVSSKPEKTAEQSTSTSTITYDDIKTPFLSLAKIDLAQAQAVLAEFGLGGSLKAAKPEQYKAIAKRLGEILDTLA